MSWAWWDKENQRGREFRFARVLLGWSYESSRGLESSTTSVVGANGRSCEGGVTVFENHRELSLSVR